MQVYGTSYYDHCNWPPVILTFTRICQGSTPITLPSQSTNSPYSGYHGITTSQHPNRGTFTHKITPNVECIADNVRYSPINAPITPSFTNRPLLSESCTRITYDIQWFTRNKRNLVRELKTCLILEYLYTFTPQASECFYLTMSIEILPRIYPILTPLYSLQGRHQIFLPDFQPQPHYYRNLE